MKNIHFENVGLGRTAYAKADLEVIPSKSWAAGLIFGSEIGLYQISNFQNMRDPTDNMGEDPCSFLEKALAHFVSFKIAEPTPGKVFMDVGRCVSAVPQILRRYHGCDCYVQDLELLAGVHGWNVGSNTAEIPLLDSSIDGMTLHCTFEHFEGDADSQFIHECACLLKAGGQGGYSTALRKFALDEYHGRNQ